MLRNKWVYKQQLAVASPFHRLQPRCKSKKEEAKIRCVVTRFWPRHTHWMYYITYGQQVGREPKEKYGVQTALIRWRHFIIFTIAEKQTNNAPSRTSQQHTLRSFCFDERIIINGRAEEVRRHTPLINFWLNWSLVKESPDIHRRARLAVPWERYLEPAKMLK
jgi:hypothetical protein